MFSGSKYNSIITKYARHKHVQKNEIVFKILICANFILNVFSQSILVKINFVTFPFCSNCVLILSSFEGVWTLFLTEKL